MNVSVLIPAYNASKTIEQTLLSVLSQTSLPEEVIVLDDGSTDSTYKILETFADRIRIIRQPNAGVASARNRLCSQATGDIIAFLDSDDLWHPQYLQRQCLALSRHPNAVASFSNHINIDSEASHTWNECPPLESMQIELIPSGEFISRYNTNPGPFGSPSYCCIRRSALNKIGTDPFPASLRLAEDYFVMNVLPFFGDILFISPVLVAYRETRGSLSSDRLKAVRYAMSAFKLLEVFYEKSGRKDFNKSFETAFASKQREYAKYLAGSGNIGEARSQLWSALVRNSSPLSGAKTMGLLISTFLPSAFQPRWPSANR